MNGFASLFSTTSSINDLGLMIPGSTTTGIPSTYPSLLMYLTISSSFISSLIFAASLGIGVLFAAAFVLVFQGAIVLVAQAVSPFLTDYVVSEMTCAGSILIIALGLNILGVTNLKVMNFLPAIFLPIVLCLFM